MALPVIKEEPGYSRGCEAVSVVKTGEWRFITPVRVAELSPCKQLCPLGSAVPEWMEAVKRNDWEGAWQIISKTNPFPALTGYVCFNPCTEKCNRGQVDEVIDIPGVERAIGRWREENYRPPDKDKAQKGKIAVVGAGPAGLSCAFYLNNAGYDLTVYEKSAVAGGVPALAIPSYRLPGQAVRREAEMLKRDGIKFIMNAELGRDYQLEELYDEYDRIFLAIGAWLPRRAAIPGEEAEGVWSALEFLESCGKKPPEEVRDRIIVIGGGNAAVDSARSALRLPGVKEVNLIYRRSREEMPADRREVAAAEAEGVNLVFNAAPLEIIVKYGRAAGLTSCYSKSLEGKLVMERGKIKSMECDAVITALGHEPDYAALGNLSKAGVVLAGGDLGGGPANVPEAIKAGRIAAEAIISQLEGLPEPNLKSPGENAVLFENLNLAAPGIAAYRKRQDNPCSEAERCLGCGSCNSCGICYTYCPDLAVEKIGGRFEFNLDYCKGCGICAGECPARALIMEGGRLE